MRKIKQYYKIHIKPHLPLFAQKAINVVNRELQPNQIRAKIRANIRKYRWLSYLRVQKITRVLGPQYKRSRKFIEIDITYACNLKCFNCNRSCTQAPSQEYMTVAQIRHFLNESISANICWECIRILGGEPTLHPDFLEIIDMIRSWKLNYAPEARVEVATNGYGRRVREVLSLIPEDVSIIDSHKDNRRQEFDAFNIAPSDLAIYRYADFRNGCIITEVCGIGLTPYGWYPCAIAGAIDRVFGFDIGCNKLPSKDDDMYEQLEKFCSLCGHFDRRLPKACKPAMSKTWKTAYQNYRKHKPVLSLYGELIKENSKDIP